MAEGGERREDTREAVSWEPKKQGRTNRGQARKRPLGFSQKAVAGDLLKEFDGVMRTKLGPGAEEEGKTLLFSMPGGGVSLLEEGCEALGWGFGLWGPGVRGSAEGLEGHGGHVNWSQGTYVCSGS